MIAFCTLCMTLLRSSVALVTATERFAQDVYFRFCLDSICGGVGFGGGSGCGLIVIPGSDDSIVCGSCVL